MKQKKKKVYTSNINNNDINFKKLKEITDKLIPLENFIKADSKMIEYKIENGTSFGFGIWTEKDIAIQRSFMSKDSTFPMHVHSEREWLIVYKGCLIVTIDNKETSLGIGDGIQVPANTKHHVTAKEDSWLIGITIPANIGGYPDARK